ncbi:MAG TPA: ATP synthase F0 subunit C [Phycisphaerae bacterium]|nr:ATP synthase F0 subunit C [Phycisphaerae bacterium]
MFKLNGTQAWALCMASCLLLAWSSTAAAQGAGEYGQTEAVSSNGGFMLFDANGAAYFAACIGAALVIIGGAKGISRVGGSAVESMARQPEAAGNINVAMIITAAMIEGATLFAVVVCLLGVLK